MTDRRLPCSVRVMCVLWPSFLMAGVIEGLVFTFFDPLTLQEFSSALAGLAPLAVYSLGFLVIWMSVAAAGALTMWLVSPPAQDDGLALQAR